MAKLTSGDLKKFITDNLFADAAWTPQPSASAYRKAKYWKRNSKFTFNDPDTFSEKASLGLQDLTYSDRQRGTLPKSGTYTCREFVFELDGVSESDQACDTELADTHLFIITDAADEQVVYCAASSD
jgi:hypothetical protein